MTPITLADGVFDPLHDRHVAYLRAAAAVAPAHELVVQVSAQHKRLEWLPRASRAVVVQGVAGVQRVVLFGTTAEALEAVRPAFYVKGADWRDRGIPATERELCDRLGIRVEYLSTGWTCSATRLLRDWAIASAEQGVQRLDADARGQAFVPFDAAAQGYDSFEARATIEGRHPDILAELCRGRSVLDVGCGPGHLVRMLRERGVSVEGIDPQAPDGAGLTRGTLDDVRDDVADVVVCREVLEHVPVHQVGAFLANLFRVARERVYLTTRFHPHPAHPFDLTDEHHADPSHITLLPRPFVRALCVTMGGVEDHDWEAELDWQHKGRVLVYRVTR